MPFICSFTPCFLNRKFSIQLIDSTHISLHRHLLCADPVPTCPAFCNLCQKYFAETVDLLLLALLDNPPHDNLFLYCVDSGFLNFIWLLLFLPCYLFYYVSLIFHPSIWSWWVFGALWSDMVLVPLNPTNESF